MKLMNLEERLNALHQFGVDFPTATIFLAGEIDGNLSTALRIKYAMLKDYYRTEKDPLNEINISLNSYGGDANSITAVLDFFDEVKDKDNVLVNVKAEGICMSAATFIIGGATGKRTASKRCRFMVHEMQIEGVGGTATQTKSTNVEIERMQKECYELYAQMSFRNRIKSGEIISPEEFEKSAATWEKLCIKETYLSAEEAIKKGLIDCLA